MISKSKLQNKVYTKINFYPFPHPTTSPISKHFV